MYFWPYCDVCICPPTLTTTHAKAAAADTTKKHPWITALEQDVLKRNPMLDAATLIEWDNLLEPMHYMKRLVKYCKVDNNIPSQTTIVCSEQ